MPEQYENKSKTSDIILCLFAIFSCLLVLLMILTDKEMKPFVILPVTLLSISIIIAVYKLFKPD